MSSAFYIYPENNHKFPIEELISNLLRFEGISLHPNDPHCLIVCEDNNHAQDIIEALTNQPNVPQWVVFIDMSENEIGITREAPQNTLSKAILPLQYILEQGFSKIEDNESRVIDMSHQANIAEFLLLS